MEEEAEEAMEEMGRKKALEAALRLQRSYRRRRMQLAVEATLLAARRRRLVLGELRSTEESYNVVLQQLCSLYHSLPSPSAPLLLPHILSLSQLHSDFLRDLLLPPPQPPADRSSLARRLLQLARDAGPIYAQHVCLLDDAQAAIATASGPTLLAMEACRSPNGLLSGPNYVLTLLIAPTQRLGRYPLLLAEVLKSTSDIFPDFALLTEAHAAFRQLAEDCNAQKRLADRHRRQDFLRKHSSLVKEFQHELQLRDKMGVPKIKLRYCGHCEKAIWSISKKHYKCLRCRKNIHLECKGW